MASLSNDQDKKSLFSRRIFSITDYELSNGSLRFFDKKGLLKKRMVLIKEIPVYEITSIESYWNEVSITWNGVANLFFRKDSFESFSDLREKIQVLLEEHKRELEFNEKASLRKNDLIAAIDASIDATDLAFNILMGLHQKRVNWESLEDYSNNLKTNLKLPLQTMAPLTLDFSKVALAIKLQVPRETAEQAFGILKSIYDYFGSLKSEFDLMEAHPNFQDAKGIVTAYFTLNDLLLGKVVHEKDDKEEKHQLESLLQILAINTNFKVDIEELETRMDSINLENELGSTVNDTREFFKKHIAEL